MSQRKSPVLTLVGVQNGGRHEENVASKSLSKQFEAARVTDQHTTPNEVDKITTYNNNQI